MRLDVSATERHYAAHLAPIWLALPPPRRGRWYVARAVVEDVARLGIPPTSIVAGRPPREGPPIAVASAQDLRRARPRPAVMVNHGAGQTYAGTTSTSYSGGRGRDAVVLNVCPGPRDVEVVRAAQPNVPAVAAGCAYLDPWHDGTRPRRPAGRPVVAVSFHAEINVCPETRSSLWHYADAVAALARRDDVEVLGHGHPRLWRRARPIWQAAGIEPVREWPEILDRADLYVVDNSSTAYEFASTGRPVLLLNAPWYRRDVDHGLRFWDLIPGIECDDPRDLSDAVVTALDDPPAARALRERATGRVYAPPDGCAAARAAAAIAETLGDDRWPTPTARRGAGPPTAA